jgi:Putative inner membrane protein (DUF1819)
VGRNFSFGCTISDEDLMVEWGLMGVYSASLTKGSLQVGDSRIIADLLLKSCTPEEWRKAILEDNVLQKRSPSAAHTSAEMIAKRLRTMQPALWEFVRDGSSTLATQACLAAAVKQNPLIGDFLDIVVREEHRVFHKHLQSSHWSDFVQNNLSQDDNAASWTPTVLVKLRQTLFRVLAEAGYVSDTKTLQLQTVTIAPELIAYLERENEVYALRCLSVATL